MTARQRKAALDETELRRRLSRRAGQARIELPPALAEGLARYLTLLATWNLKINLTALDDPDEAIDRLVIEPLVAAKHVPKSAASVLDVGSGSGSPAIPLKLAVPRLDMTMVEAKTRKSAFLRETVRHLALDRTWVETSRLEQLLTRSALLESVDLVTVRAVRLQTKELRTLQAFVRPGGQVFLFRGPGRFDQNILQLPLAVEGDRPLVNSLQSRLLILRKAQ